MADEESFKITDRRGRSSEPTTADTERPAAPAAPPEAQPEAAGPRPAPGGHRADKPDLQGLLLMFASSALIHLGDAPDPVTGEQRVDLPQAQHAIDLLLLLRDKTEGNRTDQESRILEQILYDLQMRFVDATRSR